MGASDRQGVFSRERLGMLVQSDRVHRSVYADPGVFDLEMQRIFGRAWLVVRVGSRLLSS